MTISSGTRVGPYEILDRLGGGGMGVVYKARDTRLDRPAALKFLPPELSRDDDAKRRFLREAKVASALDHPNICTIYEVGESTEGQLFIAMAYYGGETLKRRLEGGPLEVAEALDVARQVAHGLAKAHDAGIVHRDIKPANLMVTADGLVKIVDFGVAKLAGELGLTQTGTTLGTVAYMSPEQAAGREVDRRTDLWALGVVLYEMLTGRTPFRGDGPQAVIHNVLNREPEPLEELRADLPAAVCQAVRRALAKDRTERYQTAANMESDLDTVRRIVDTAATQATKAAGARTPSIAVLPFSNMSADPEQEYFCDGLAEELIDALARLEGLRVVARTSAFKFKGQADDIRRIGEQLSVETVLEGSVRKAGNRLRINAQLINVADGYHLWSERYDRTMDDIFAVQEEIAQAIVEKLKIKLVGEPGEALIELPAENVEAYHLYLQGRHHLFKLSKTGIARALECFEQALSREPRHIRSLCGIATVFAARSIIGWEAPHEAMPRMREAARKALAIDEQSGPAHASMACFLHWYEWKWAEAEAEIRRAIELVPNDADTHSFYAEFLGHRGRFDEAITEARRSVELDPLSLQCNRILALELWGAGRIAESENQARKTLDLEPRYFPARVTVALAQWADQRYHEAVEVLEQGREDARGDPALEGCLGLAYGLAGRAADASQVVEQLIARRSTGYLSACSVAMVYTGLGMVDETLQWLSTAYDERDGLCPTLASGWTLQAEAVSHLREDPRYQDLLRRIEAGGTE